MIRFKTKNSLIQWLVDNCPRRAIIRSLLQHGAECLGGFSRIPPSSQPGWIIRTTSSFGKTWIVAVLAYDNPPKYGIRILQDVPWQYWVGGEPELYCGDKPILYNSLQRICENRNG